MTPDTPRLEHDVKFDFILVCSSDCEHFEMTPPLFEVADEISKDLSNYEAMWFLLEEFNTGLQELAKEDWISFRFVLFFQG